MCSAAVVRQSFLVSLTFDTGYHIDVDGKVAVVIVEEAINTGEIVDKKLASAYNLIVFVTDCGLRLWTPTRIAAVSPHDSITIDSCQQCNSVTGPSARSYVIGIYFPYGIIN